MADTVAVAHMDAELWRRIRDVLDSSSSNAIKTKLIDTLISPPPTAEEMAAGDITEGGLWLTAAEVVARGGRASIKAVQVAACQLNWRKKGGGKGKKALYWHEDALRPLGRPGRKMDPAPTQNPDPREPLLPFADIGGPSPAPDHSVDAHEKVSGLLPDHPEVVLEMVESHAAADISPEDEDAIDALINNLKRPIRKGRAKPRPPAPGIGDGVEYEPPEVPDRHHYVAPPPKPISGPLVTVPREELREVEPVGRRVERIIEIPTPPGADTTRTPGAVRHITFVKD